jgi:hypothetical protein
VSAVLKRAILKAEERLLDARRSVEDDQELRDAMFLAAGLVRTLAHIAGGMDIMRAFGAPGDWGYGTPIGDAVLQTLRERRTDISGCATEER